MIQNRISMMMAIAELGALAAAAKTSTTTTRTSDSPSFGLAAAETARVSLTNLATASSSGTAASCTGSVSFISPAGAVIGTASPFTITTGQTSSDQPAVRELGTYCASRPTARSDTSNALDDDADPLLAADVHRDL